MEIRVIPNRTELWAIPFEDRGDFVVEPVTGTRLPAGAIDDLAEIRKGNDTS